MDKVLEFLAQHLGLAVDLDREYGPQCMDLVNLWMDANHLPRISGNARDVPYARIQGATWEPNGPTNSPPPGAIVCWRPNVAPLHIGEFGHVALAVVGSPQLLLTADQNWGGRQYVAINLHYYLGIVGWWQLPEA